MEPIRIILEVFVEPDELDHVGTELGKLPEVVYLYEVTGGPDIVDLTSTYIEVFAALKRLGGTATAIAIRDELARSTNPWAKANISPGLRRLVDLGYVEKLGDGRFRIVEEFQDGDV